MVHPSVCLSSAAHGPKVSLVWRVSLCFFFWVYEQGKVLEENAKL